jgi:iron(III) transport system ATP-binding protein
VFFDAARGIALPPEERGLGLVFQSYALWPHRTVFENVATGLRLRGTATKEIKRRVEKTLDQIGLIYLADRMPAQLSGGQQQRVSIARALVYEPPVILLDEPLSNLDAKLREEARAWLRQLIVTLNLSALCVTHDQIEAMAIADSVTLLNAGTVEQEGTPTELYTTPNSLFAAEFMGSNNRLDGVLIESSRERSVLDVAGQWLVGMTRCTGARGDKATGVIRIERVRIGGGPGANRIPMRLTAQMYLGERWEAVFSHEALPGLTVRAYINEPLRHDAYHVEFPSESLWIF